MSWIKEAAGFGKKLLFLSERVDRNAEAIEGLRQDLNQLQGDVRKIATAVQFDRSKLQGFREWTNDKNETLYWKLRAEMAEFENRLNALYSPKKRDSLPSNADEIDLSLSPSLDNQDNCEPNNEA